MAALRTPEPWRDPEIEIGHDEIEGAGVREIEGDTVLTAVHIGRLNHATDLAAIFGLKGLERQPFALSQSS